MHDDPVTVEKPDGTFRIAVLGSSIDMGWGVKHQDTYINQLEDVAERAFGPPGARAAAAVRGAQFRRGGL